jgi:hypothetical protein
MRKLIAEINERAGRDLDREYARHDRRVAEICRRADDEIKALRQRKARANAKAA